MDEELSISIGKITELKSGRNISQENFQIMYISSKDEKFFKQAIIGRIDRKDRDKNGYGLLSRMTPLFDEINIINNDSTSELSFIGIRDGISYICKTGSLVYDYNKWDYQEFELEGEYKYGQRFGNDIYAIATDKGAFLFSLKTMEQISDTFDEIKIADWSFGYISSGSTIFLKNIYIMGIKILFVGELSIDGKIGPHIYATDFDCDYDTPLVKSEEPYDKLDSLMLHKITVDKLIENRNEKEKANKKK